MDVAPAPSGLRRRIRRHKICFCGEDGFQIASSSQVRPSFETVNDIPVSISMTRTVQAERDPISGPFVTFNPLGLAVFHRGQSKSFSDCASQAAVGSRLD